MNTHKAFSVVFTIVQIIIAVVFAAIIGITIYDVSQGNPNNLSVGFNGMIETRCVGGYTFVLGQDGNVKQVMDEYGKGKACK
jgi:hypothetical protein